MAFLIALFNNRLFLWIVGGGAVAASLFLAVRLGVADGTIKGLNRDLVTTNKAWNECKVDLSVKTTEALGLRGAIDDQNRQIDDWKQKAESAQERAERLVAQARKEAADWRAKAARTAAAKANGPDLCHAASELYIENATEDRK